MPVSALRKGSVINGVYLFRWVGSCTTRHSDECTQIYAIATVLGYLVVGLCIMVAWSRRRGALVALVQISKYLLPTKQLPNVPLWIMLVDSCVHALRAPMFELNLCRCDGCEEWPEASDNNSLLPSVMCSCLLCHVRGWSSGSPQAHAACMCSG